MLNDNKDFYPTLNKELRNFLAVHFNLPIDEINKKRMADEMDKRNISIANSLQLQKLMDDIEWHLYTPFADQNKMQEIYGRADIIDTLFL
ncbi:MAG: hypothetical protein WDM71_11385 [Ferruginibacter sp.]